MASETYSFDSGYTGGLRIDMSPDKIPANSSPNMENISYDDGSIPTKRHGFSKLSTLVLNPTPIRLMAEFKTGGVTEFLIICGGNLFKKN